MSPDALPLPAPPWVLPLSGFAAALRPPCSGAIRGKSALAAGLPFRLGCGAGLAASAQVHAVLRPCNRLVVFCRCYSLKFKDFFLHLEKFILQRPDRVSLPRPENFKEDVFVAANAIFAAKAGRPAGFLWYTVKNQYETALNRVRFIPLQYSSCLPYTVYNIMYFCLFMSLTGPQPAVAVHPNMSPPFLLSERSVSSSISTGCSPKLSAISFSLRSLSRRIR